MSSNTRVMHNLVLAFKEDAKKEDIENIFKALAELKQKNLVPGILSFTYGPYQSPEGLNNGFTHGSSMVFESIAARDAYLPHPEHDRVKPLIIAIIFTKHQEQNIATIIAAIHRKTVPTRQKRNISARGARRCTPCLPPSPSNADEERELDDMITHLMNYLLTTPSPTTRNAVRVRTPYAFEDLSEEEGADAARSVTLTQVFAVVQAGKAVGSSSSSVIRP